MKRALIRLGAWPLPLSSMLLLGACGQLPKAPVLPDAPPAVGVSADARFFAAHSDAPLPGPQDRTWWQRFDSPALSFWVERALVQNLDLTLAASRVAEARALLRSAQGARGLSLDADLRLTARQPAGSSGRRVEPTAALSLAWDADLWGALRWDEAAAGARLQQAAQLTQAARLSVAALTARAFVGWQEARLDAVQIKASIALQREVARIVQIRVDAGLSPPLDAQRARGQLAATEAAAVDAAARVDDTARALQLLAGDPPGGPMPAAGGAGGVDTAQLPTLQGAAPVVWPVDLLRLRPDLQAAEQAWRAAVADTGAVAAARRPSLRLPGLLTLGSTTGGALLGQVTASLAAALAVPLLDGGQRDADRAAALAREQAAAIGLQQAVQQALGEVEAALRATESGRARLAAQTRAVQEAEASVDQARTLYTAGLAGFLDVLDAQRSALERRQTLLRMQGDAARASVATFEALGLIDAPG